MGKKTECERWENIEKSNKSDYIKIYSIELKKKK